MAPEQEDNMPSKITRADKAEFRQFCQQATAAQLEAIIEKETAAGRRTYAAIAEQVKREREG
jgi:hypothetical protein